MPIIHSPSSPATHTGPVLFSSQSHATALAGIAADAAAVEAPATVFSGAKQNLVKQVQRALATKAQGIPAEFADAWEWAAHWTQEHGVTLPPDTSEWRSLRNFFCYQMSMFKKNRLSPKSAAKFAKHGIDLARYKAPCTGSGKRFDDEACLQQLRAHYAAHGTYDLHEGCSVLLLTWQTRLLKTYCASGQSGRMRAMAATLPGFSFGNWLKPGDSPIPSSEYSWWALAREFRVVAKAKPAFRGKIDLSMSLKLRTWASEQIALQKQGLLSARQSGELRSLQITACPSHLRSQEKAALLASARAQGGLDNLELRGKCQRDVTTFLGAALLVTMVRHGAASTSIYRKLCVYPAQYARMAAAIEPFMQRLDAMATKSNLTRVRAIYREDPNLCESMFKMGKLPVNACAELTANQGERIAILAKGILEVRDTMRRMNVRQDLQTVAFGGV